MRAERDTEPVGSLIQKLVSDGRTYATATVDIYRQKALSWVPAVRTAAIFVVVALFLAQAAITTLLVFIGFWLALWLGPLGGGIAASMLALVVAFVLVKLALGEFGKHAAGAGR